MAELGPSWIVAASEVVTEDSRRATFGRRAPLLLDIGVGNGLATLAWAGQRTDADIVAFELHRPGIVKLLRAIEAEERSNVRVVEDDALLALAQLEPGSVDAIRVLFPDPWPKRRHVRRRLVDRSFVGTAADLLAPRGSLLIATDWADYAEHITSMVATDPRLVPDHPASRPDRPVTAYEQRGLDAGRTIVDLCYRRTDGDQVSAG